MNTLKSKLIKLIMTGLLVLTTFAFVSCGENPDPENGSEPGSETGGGTGSIMTEEQISGKLANLGAYRIKCKVNSSDWDSEDSTSYYEIGKTQDTYWSLSDGHGFAGVIDGEYIYLYDADPDDNGNAVWEYNMTYNYREDKIEDDLQSMYNAFGTGYGLFYIYDNKEGLTKKTTKTLAGRTCTVYSKTESQSDSSLGVSLSQSTDVYVDNQTGITMKVAESYTYNGQSFTWGYEVTTFETGNAVQVPTLPAPTDD